MARKVLCLDWDKRSLRIVSASVGGGQVRLLDAHQHRIPSAIDADTPETMGAFIADALARHGLRASRVIVDVPRDKAVINRLKLPPTPLNEVAAAVRFQALRELPFPLDEAEIDYTILDRESGKLCNEVLLAAVRLETLNRIKQTCTIAGLTPVRIGLRPFANLMSATRLPALLERRVLFIDVGPAITEIDVFRGNNVVFSRAASVGVPFQAGEPVSDDSRITTRAELAEIDAAEDSTVDEIVVEVTRTLQAYRAAEANATIDQIVVAGGTGVEQSLLGAIDERFGLPAMLFDPTTSLGVAATEAPKLRSFAAALGLAWGVSKDGLLDIDFLNPKRPIPTGAVLKQRVRIATIAAIGCLGALGAWVTADLIKLNRRLSELRKTNEPHLAEYKALADMKIRTEEALEWGSQERMTVWLDHLKIITEQAVNPGKEMLLTDMTCDAAKGAISLKVDCSDWKVGSNFVGNLKSAAGTSGKPLYEVTPKTQVDSKSDDKFRSSLPVDLSIRAIAAHQANVKARVAERAKYKEVP